MSKESREIVDNLLLRRLVAREHWAFVFSLFWINQVMPKMVLELFVCWKKKCSMAQIC